MRIRHVRIRLVFESLIMHRAARSTLSSVLSLLLVTSVASAQEAKSDSASSASSSAAASSEAAEKSGGVSAADVQNPVASLVSVPFQNNTYFDVGPYKSTANAMLVEPVVPFKLGEDWALISRTIFPIVYEPRVSPDSGGTFGLGNVQPQFYLTPAHPGSIIWGIGPQLWLPTATDKSLGNNHLGGGPAVALLSIQGHWLYGALISQMWAGNGKERINELTVEPIVYYNMAHGWYLVSTPVATAQWAEVGRNVWTVPVGGGLGRLFKVGSQPINMRIEAFDNVHRPDFAPSWQVQFQVQFLFPKH
jgi:hypothetical protein